MVKKSKIKSRRLIPLLLTIPFVVHIIMFQYIPLFGWSFAFMNFRPGIPLSRTPWVGLANFRLFLGFYRPQVLNVLRNTMIFSMISIILSPTSMIFAIFLNEVTSVKLRRFIQTTTTLPNFVSWVIVFGLAFAVFRDQGIVNQVLLRFGLIDRPTMLLGNLDAVYVFQTSLSVWKGIGWGAIIYIAAIAGLDTELYDAAAVDGAGRFRRVWHVTIPGLMPTYLVLLLLNIGSLLSVGFEQYFVFNNALVQRNIEVLGVFVYRVGLLQSDFSFATAVGILTSIVNITTLFTVNYIAKKVRGESLV